MSSSCEVELVAPVNTWLALLVRGLLVCSWGLYSASPSSSPPPAGSTSSLGRLGVGAIEALEVEASDSECLGKTLALVDGASNDDSAS